MVRFIQAALCCLWVCACAPVPLAQLDMPACATAGVPILLNAEGSRGTAGSSITRFMLSPGDGSPALVRESGRTLHTYAAPGTYTARATVTDAWERTAHVERTVTVSNTPGLCADPNAAPRLAISACALDGVLDCLLDLGSVPLGTLHTQPVVLTNPGAGLLVVDALDWVPDVADGALLVQTDVQLPFSLAPGGQATVRVVASPTAPGLLGGTLRIHSNAVNAPLADGFAELPVFGVTPEIPFARLEVEPNVCAYGTIPYATTVHCALTLTSTGTRAVTVDQGTLRQGTPTAFVLQGAMSVTLQPGQAFMMDVEFTPPGVGDFAGTLTFESTDDARPVQTIPLRGTGAETPPVAVVELLSVNGQPPPAGLRVKPLDNVVLTARNSRVGRPGRTVVEYQFELLARPDNSTVVLTQPTSSETQFVFNSSGADRLGLDVVGEYTVQLTVTDNVGVRSAPVPITLVARPGGDLVVQLTWLEDSSDVDLHLVRGVEENRFTEQDCYYSNCASVGGLTWFSQAESNPGLDVDDTDGFGPENITVGVLRDGTYHVGVHYFSSVNDQRTLTVRTQVFIYDQVVLDQVKALTRCNDFWNVATLVVSGGQVTTDANNTIIPVTQGGCVLP